jgi:phosphatidylglycerophosphate synthase
MKQSAPRRRRALALPVAAVPVSGALSVAVAWMGEPVPGVALAAVLAGVSLVSLAVVSVARRRGVVAGPADTITLLRAALVGACACWAVLTVAGDLPARSWWLVWLALPALLLDGLDGVVARRTGTSSPEGARLDMETDAALILVLSVVAAQVVGPWVLLIGAMRYLWALAALVRPALGGPLPESRARRVVAAVQGGVLVGVVAPAVTEWLAVGAAVLALLLLVLSFARDAITLERAAAGSPAATDRRRR